MKCPISYKHQKASSKMSRQVVKVLKSFNINAIQKNFKKLNGKSVFFFLEKRFFSIFKFCYKIQLN